VIKLSTVDDPVYGASEPLVLIGVEEGPLAELERERCAVLPRLGSDEDDPQLAVAVAAALTLLILVVAVAAISSESLAAILTKGLEGFVEYLKYNFEGFKEYLAWLLEILRELA